MPKQQQVVLTPRCEVDALRIRQRRGPRRRHKVPGMHTDYDTKEGSENRTTPMMLAEMYSKYISHSTLATTSLANVGAPSSQNPEASFGRDDIVEPEGAQALAQSTGYFHQYYSSILERPESRHSNTRPHGFSGSRLSLKIDERARNIYASYQTLREILLRHERTIQARWTRKRPSQRQKLLLELWPNMPKMHRPDFYALRFRDCLTKIEEYRDWYMWPYINIQDLTARNSLMLLMNSRGFCQPSKFAEVDRAALKVGLMFGMLESIPVPGYAIILDDAETPKDYGRLIDITAYSEEDLSHLDKTRISPYYGILVLEVQDRLLTFLVDCCKQILHDVPGKALISDKFPVLPPLPPMVTEVVNSTPAVMAAEAPYRVPVKPDFTQISSMLGAKASEAKDHFINLREDPTYFASALKTLGDYRVPRPSPNTKDGTISTDYLGKISLHRQLDCIISQAFHNFEGYTDLYRQVQVLEALQAKCEAAFIPSQELSDELLAQVLIFQVIVWEHAKLRRRALGWALQTAPESRRYFSHILQTYDCHPGKGSEKKFPVHGHLLCLLQHIIFYDPAYPSLIDYDNNYFPLFMDQIETLRDNEPEAWEITDSLAGGIIDELSILAQCVEQIELCIRLIPNFDNAVLGRQDQFMHDYAKEKQHIYSIAKVRCGIYRQVMHLADCANKRFFYPCDRRRTRENVEAMQKAERNLDEFWASTDKAFFDRIQGFTGSFIGQQIRDVQKTLQRTPDWVEEPRLITTEQARRRNNSQGELEVYTLPSDLHSNQSQDGKKLRTTSHNPIRSKIKKKGEPHNVIEQPNMNAVKEPTLKPPSPIPVDKRALKVFQVLFYNPEATSSVGEVLWKDFIHAMVYTGFSAQKLHGSIWQFCRADDDGQRTILFHEPHPQKKLPFLTARSFGRRLNRNFQWTFDTFESK